MPFPISLSRQVHRALWPHERLSFTSRTFWRVSYQNIGNQSISSHSRCSDTSWPSKKLVAVKVDPLIAPYHSPINRSRTGFILEGLQAKAPKRIYDPPPPNMTSRLVAPGVRKETTDCTYSIQRVVAHIQIWIFHSGINSLLS